jgi:hypothetical protein
MSEEKSTCQWHQDGDPDSETWATGCKQYFTIIEGTPTENHFKFCCYCGKPLEELPWEDEEEE